MTIFHEMFLLLGALVFLSVRTDYVQRTWAFVLAVLLWGVARVLPDLPGVGQVEDHPVWLPQLNLATILQAACVLMIFVACRRPRARAGHVVSLPPPPAPSDVPPPPAAKSLERLREVQD